MAAADHLQPQQLSMFMSAREITTSYQALDGDRDRGENDAKLYARKRREADKYDTEFEHVPPSLGDDIRSNGVKEPVRLSVNAYGAQGKPQVTNGHHRIGVMLAHDPDALMPVQHDQHNWGRGGPS